MRQLTIYWQGVIVLAFLLVFSSSNAAGIDFDTIKGKWIRPDGGYLLTIKDIHTNGNLTAGYYNPLPIHVQIAKVSKNEDKIEIYVELQDVNYPGSTYTLTYAPERDILHGIYFQALEKVKYRVYFERKQ